MTGAFWTRRSRRRGGAEAGAVRRLRFLDLEQSPGMTWTAALIKNLKIGRRFRDLGIETKMLAIILPLVAIPMIVLGTVGYVASSGQATASGTRYLGNAEAICT